MRSDAGHGGRRFEMRLRLWLLSRCSALRPGAAHTTQLRWSWCSLCSGSSLQESSFGG